MCRAKDALVNNFNKLRIADADHPLRVRKAVHVNRDQQPSRKMKYEFPINRKWFAPYRWTKNSFGCRPRLNTSL